MMPDTPDTPKPPEGYDTFLDWVTRSKHGVSRESVHARHELANLRARLRLLEGRLKMKDRELTALRADAEKWREYQREADSIPDIRSPNYKEAMRKWIKSQGAPDDPV